MKSHYDSLIAHTRDVIKTKSAQSSRLHAHMAQLEQERNVYVRVVVSLLAWALTRVPWAQLSTPAVGCDGFGHCGGSSASRGTAR